MKMSAEQARALGFGDEGDEMQLSANAVWIALVSEGVPVVLKPKGGGVLVKAVPIAKLVKFGFRPEVLYRAAGARVAWRQVDNTWLCRPCARDVGEEGDSTDADASLYTCAHCIGSLDMLWRQTMGATAAIGAPVIAFPAPRERVDSDEFEIEPERTEH